jgi:hypothetical protein
MHIALGVLNYELRLVRDWYHAAQQQQRFVDKDDEWPDSNSNVVVEKDEANDESSRDRVASSALTSTTDDDPGKHLGHEPQVTRAETEAKSIARRQLARQEILALFSCFIGPVLGSYLLHVVRLRLLTRPAEGL